MAADLVQQLTDSLGSTYAIARELGGGGMSRVFLAEDKALGRSVVIKVLLPELAAGVNAERFKREVQLSARLQHPHIVPVLTAGEVDALPYYVMPFVKGESLRARLAAGPLPIAETIGILADVAKALAYAQSEGVVHRDIKPDNILLSGGASTVADFGIAKAISSARQPEQGETLTSLGTSLGTPAYMAPEQVAGDPGVDHRADIYSLGCVAYEMLTGHSPFAGKSPQQMFAAQVMETPRPIKELRPDAPPALVSLVNRMLEKEPSARPQSAAELATQLEATASGSLETPSRARRARKAPVWGVVAAGVVIGAAAIVGYRVHEHPAAVRDTSLSVAVAPFEVFDPQLGLWKEGMVDVLSRNIDGSGPIRAVPPAASIKRWEGHADRSVATAFGKRVGAQIVVYGQLQSAGRDLVDAKVWVVDATRDAQPIEVSFRDSVARMDRVTDSLSVKVLAAIGRNYPIGAAKIASLGSGSLPAIKAFLQGSQYFRRTQWDSAAASFREAVALDTTFGIAYAHLAQAVGWSKGYGSAEGIDANRRAGRLVHAGLSPHDSLMLTAVGHYALAGTNGRRNTAETRAAITAATALADRYPNDPEAWYLLGDMRYHSDYTLTEREALNYFDRAIAADSDFAPAYIHATELAYRNGADLGRRYADAYLRRDPRDSEGEGIRLAARVADPNAKPADVRAVLDTVTPRVAQKAFAALNRMPDTAEAPVAILRAAIKRSGTSAQAHGFTQVLAGQLALHGHIAEAWKLAVESQGYIAGEIAGLGLVPADSAKVLEGWIDNHDDSFLASFPVLANAGDTARLLSYAARLEKSLEHDTTANRPVRIYVLGAMRAYAALAARDTVRAAKLFDALPDSVVTLPYDEFVRARLIGRTDPKRAIDILERHANTADLVFGARELERGRLAEKIGDRERAVDAYTYVAEVWKNADAKQLRDGAKEAAGALNRLDSDGRMRAQLAGSPKR